VKKNERQMDFFGSMAKGGKMKNSQGDDDDA
jgi:hypothetical protein